MTGALHPLSGPQDAGAVVIDVAEHPDRCAENLAGVLLQLGAGVVGDLGLVVGEVGPDQRGGLGEQGHPGLDQLGDGLEPGQLPEAGAVGEDVLALEVGQQARGELADLELADVDTVEPLELLGSKIGPTGLILRQSKSLANSSARASTSLPSASRFGG